jgi:hypothetical protein
MRDRFALLLNDYSALAARGRTSVAPLTARISTLLKQFGEHFGRAVTSELARAAADCEHIRVLLGDYNNTVERYEHQQVQLADDFNLLEVMQLTGKEIRHSMVLAWLLDRDMRKLGTHAQGNLGFRLFLEEFNLPFDYAACKYWVRREVTGEESIVDIEVACRDRFIIYIENKIWSCEGTDQTDREWSDLRRRGADLSVSAPYRHALYLTPHGAKPINCNFNTISWGGIAHVLEKFAEEAKPPDVKLFARHYAQVLRRSIVVENMTEDDNAKVIDE